METTGGHFNFIIGWLNEIEGMEITYVIYIYEITLSMECNFHM